MTLTQKQIEKLHKAIEQAREPGGCRYVSDGAPCCVVAQLAVLEGVSLETLERWNTSPNNWASKSVPSFETIFKSKDRDAITLANKYGPLLLQDLQQIWDDSADDNKGRNQMRDRVACEPISD